MSRRFHLGILTKNKHHKIKDLNTAELQAKCGTEAGIEVSKLSKEVFTIGKAFNDSFLKEFATPAFTSTEVHNLINKEDSFYLINQEGFKALIENFHSQIATHFKELLGDETTQSNQEIQHARFSYIYFRLQEWGNDLKIKPYSFQGIALLCIACPLRSTMTDTSNNSLGFS